MTDHQPMIHVANLTKSYGTHTVLRGVDFTVRRGAIFALLGPNGAGKTTAVHILTTLLPYDDGDIRICGFDARRDGAAVRRMIGLTGQYAAVDGFQTAEENLVMMGRLAHFSGKEAKARAHELLAEFDLLDAASQQTHTFSGGMRRRLDLAMSLVSRPQVLFLDEPTTGLDPRSRIALWGVVQRLAHEGVTIFLTTQYLEEADRLADTIAVINDGRIIACGTADELKRRIGAPHIELEFADVDGLRGAMAIVENADVTVEPETLRLLVRTESPAQTMRAVLAGLDTHQIPVTNLAIVQPSLDDVFLALTA